MFLAWAVTGGATPTALDESPLIDPVPGASGAWQKAPAAARLSDQYLAVWEDDRECSRVVYGARIGADLSVTDPLGFRISPSDRTATSPRVASGGGVYLVVWTGINQQTSTVAIEASRVDADGLVLDPVPISLSGDFQGLSALSALDYDGEAFLVVWAMPGAARQDIIASRVTPAGVIEPPAAVPVSEAPENQVRPSVACAGDGVCLCAFRDGRMDPVSPDIFAARFSRTGGLLDPAGIPVTTAANIQTNPAVAVSGGEFLVVWEDGRDDSVGLKKGIYASRVTSAGDLLDPAGIQLAAGGVSNNGAPGISATSQGFLAVWSDDRTGDFDLYVTPVALDGTVAVPGGSAVVTDRGYQGDPEPVAAAASGAAVFFATEDAGQYDGNTAAILLRDDGTAVDPTPVVVSRATQTEGFPDIAFNGTIYLAVWADYADPARPAIRAARVQSDGTVLDSSGITVSGSGEGPKAASDGLDFLVVWQQGDWVRGARVLAATGGVVDAPAPLAIHTTPGGWNPDVDWTGTQYLVAWEALTGDGDLWAARVNTDGTLPDAGGVPVVTDPGLQEHPAVACKPGLCIVVFDDDRVTPASSDVYLALVDPVTLPSPAVSIAVSAEPGSDQDRGVAAAGPEGFFIVWEDGRNSLTPEREIYATRATDDGTVLDPGGLLISDGTVRHGGPAAASTTGGYFVSWIAGAATAGCADVMGARFSASAGLFDPGGVVLSAVSRCRNRLAVASGPEGEAFTVIEGFYPDNYSAVRVQGMRVLGITYTVDLARRHSRAALTGPPDRLFPDVTFPFLDPDPVLSSDPAWATLFYQVEGAGGRLTVVKSGPTVSIAFP